MDTLPGPSKASESDLGAIIATIVILGILLLAAIVYFWYIRNHPDGLQYKILTENKRSNSKIMRE